MTSFDWPCSMCGHAYSRHADAPLANPPRCPCGGTKALFRPVVPNQALSIRQPWPAYIFDLPDKWRKDFENRTWKRDTPPGWLWVHASKTMKEHEWHDADDFAHYTVGVPEEVLPARESIVLGSLLGIVRAGDFVQPAPRYTSKWLVGPFGIQLLSRFKLPEPIAASGAQGFWQVKGDQLEQARAMVVGALAT